MQTITESFLELGIDSEISDKQLLLLDIDLEDRASWRSLALHKQISDARAELFVLLKGIATKSNQEKIIRNYKALQKFRKAPKVSRDIANEDTMQGSDVLIYCDGGCSPNPGASGSGVALYRGHQLQELWYGLHEANGTNNTAELNALYESMLLAQEYLNRGIAVEIKSDSMYAINCVKTWAINWQKSGWKKKGGPIKNLEVIKKMFALYNQLKERLVISHVKAHAGTEGNELADRMTVYAREHQEYEWVKYEGPIDVTKILSMRAG